MKSIGEIIGLRVRELRKKKGWSQTDLALNAKVSLQTVNRLEKNKQQPREDNLVAIATALGVTTSSLATIEGTKTLTVESLLNALTEIQRENSELRVAIERTPSIPSNLPPDILEELKKASGDPRRLDMLRAALGIRIQKPRREAEKKKG